MFLMSFHTKNDGNKENCDKIGYFKSLFHLHKVSRDCICFHDVVLNP